MESWIFDPIFSTNLPAGLFMTALPFGSFQHKFTIELIVDPQFFFLLTLLVNTHTSVSCKHGGGGRSFHEITITSIENKIN